MNSSVTWCRATSVMSSLCFEIRLSKRSKGPSKLSSRTSNVWPTSEVDPVLGSVRASGPAGSDAVVTVIGGASVLDQSVHQHAVMPVLVEVGQHQGDRLAYEPAPVDRQPVVAPQLQAGMLHVDQLVGGDVDRDLLVVPHPAARTSTIVVGGLRRGDGPYPTFTRFRREIGRRVCGAEQVVRGGQVHASRHRSATSLAS